MVLGMVVDYIPGVPLVATFNAPAEKYIWEWVILIKIPQLRVDTVC